MSNKEEILREFVENFILKDKKERCYAELMNPKKRGYFTDKLNHKWNSVLNMKRLERVEKVMDSTSGIQQLLRFKDHETCYVISEYDEFDDRFISFREIFNQIYCRGFASIIVNMNADTIFIDTEQVKGPADRFIGRKQKPL